MNLARTILQTDSLFRGVHLIGFTGPEAEAVRALMSRIPPEFLSNVRQVKAAPELGAKHGRFVSESKTVLINPWGMRKKERVGHGQGWIYHAEMTMAHEFGHSLYDQLTPEQKQIWLDLSGWIKTDGEDSDNYAPRYIEKRPGWPPYTSKWIHRKGVTFTRHYAEKTPDEDFADSFAFYVLGKPAQLGPWKRRFMNNFVQANIHRYAHPYIEGPERVP